MSKHLSEYSNNTATKWWRDPGMRMGVLHMGILYCAVYTIGYDGSLLSGLQALPMWKSDFNNPAGTQLGLISTCYYLPKIPATFVTAWVADRYGRKWPLYIGGFLMFAGAWAGGFSQNTAQLIGSRVILGAGSSFTQITASTLIPELSHPRLRSYAGGFFYTTYYIGAIFAAWFTFAMVYYPTANSSWSWRIPTILQGFGPFLLLLGMLFVPQSPRWLVAQGRDDEALKILAKYHANGREDDELVCFEMQQIKTENEIAKLANAASWMTFVRTPGYRRRAGVIIIVAVAAQCVGNGVVQYYLVPILKSVGITQPAQQSGINGGLSIWNFGCSLLGASLVERAGRRTLFLSALCGMLGCFILITGLSAGYESTKSTATGVAMVPFIFLFSGFYSLALTPLPTLYVPEISPMALRAKSSALWLSTAACLNAFNQYANPVALAAIQWKFYFVYIGIQIVLIALFYFFVRETRGLTIEEAAAVYDDDDADKANTMRMERELRARAEGLGREAEVEDEKAGLDKADGAVLVAPAVEYKR